MALLQCPECGKRVSSRAENCPECGYPIAKQAHSDVEAQHKNSADMQPHSELENSTISSMNGDYEHTMRRKLWIIPVVLICIMLACVITYTVMLKDAEQKKAEAQQLYTQKEYQELSWKIDEIPEFFLDDDCETLRYAGSIGTGYSLFLLHHKREYSFNESDLKSLIVEVWNASDDTWYASPNDDLSLTSNMLNVQRVVLADYYSLFENYFDLTKQEVDKAIEIGNNATNETRGDAFDEYVSSLMHGN